MEQKPKLSIVIGVLNQFEISDAVIRTMIDNLDNPSEVELVVIDNGSDENFSHYMMKDGDHPFEKLYEALCHRNEKNIGNYPIFKQALQYAHGDIVAFLHSDVFVYQKGWDTAVISQFDSHDDLGLVGFIGSTELDNWGGRGTGTVSNMQGRTVEMNGKSWTGSEGFHHGAVSGGMTIDGSVVDGCVMIFKRTVLEQIESKDNYPPHHFYDRLMSAQVIEAGYKVGILGIEFDHISGQVANTQGKWQDTSMEWFHEHLGIGNPQEWADIRHNWVKSGPNNPSAGKVPDQWDYAAYLEAEFQFLKEYRDEKHLVPLVMGKRI